MKARNWMQVGGVMLTVWGTSTMLYTEATRAGQEPTTLRALYGLPRPLSLGAPRTALVLVDFQNEFVEGKLPLPEARPAIRRAAELAAWGRRVGILVVLVQNVATRPTSPVFAVGSRTTELVPELAPHAEDLVLQKSTGGGFTRTTLDAELRARNIDAVIVGGFMTHLAVAITASDAAVLGYRVIVASDATATRALPGAGDERGVDANALQRAALDATADRAAEVMPCHAVMAIPVTR